MEVSVIIVNFNTFDLTCKCIKSILANTQDLSYEIIVVDNASTECNPDMFLLVYPGVKLIKNEQNTGFAGGNNSGIACAEGEVVLLLNSDTELVNNAIGIAYNKLKSNANIGVVSAQLLFPNGNIQSCCNRFPSVKLELIELLRLQKFLPSAKRAKLLLGSFFDHTTAIESDWVWGTFFMFRKEILQYFPEKRLSQDFFMYGEDMQWCYEIKRKIKLQIVYEPEAKVTHYLSASSSQVKKFNKQKIMANHEFLFLQKYYGRLQAYLIFKLRALKFASLSITNPDFTPVFKFYQNSRNYSQL